MKKGRANVLYCWLLIWCGTFRQQEKVEHEFLVLQAIAVIKKMSQKKDDALATYLLLMLQEVFASDNEALLRYLVELWKIDLELPVNPQFEYFDFRTNERRTTFRTAKK